MREILSAQAEDYLKRLCTLGRQHDRVGTQAIADTLGVAPASVTGMLRKLAELRLVEHAPYHGSRRPASVSRSSCCATTG